MKKPWQSHENGCKTIEKQALSSILAPPTSVFAPFMPLEAFIELPPSAASFSMIVTLAPLRAASMLAQSPAKPPPTTSTGSAI